MGSPVTPLNAVEAVATELVDCLGQPGAWVWVPGGAGSGRSVLAERLQERSAAVVVRPPSLGEADAVAHGLWQAARQARMEVDASASLESNIAEIASTLARDGRPLVLRLDNTWRLDQVPEGAESAGLLRRARQFLDAWGREDLSVALLANRLGGWRHPYAKRVPLARAEARLDSLTNEQEWGSVAGAALELYRHVGSSVAAPSPVDLRLAVGLVALGAGVETLAKSLFRAGETVRLARDLAERAMSKHQTGLRRLARLRASMASDTLARVLEVDDEDLPLFTRCFGYGETHTRISPPVQAGIRQALRSQSPSRSERESDHLALADAHQELDGVEDPARANADAIVHWLEKVHHLAHAGPVATDRWSAQAVAAPEMLWDRARILSREYQRYTEAAALYQRCIDVHPRDAYAWHYLAFNLDRAARDRANVEEGFRRAAELEPGNPWYQSRWITFLVRHGRVRDADARWSKAMRVLDPNGERTEEQPELGLHIHRWVSLAWLDAGDVKRARSVVDRLSPKALALPELATLVHRIHDAEEATSMGASVRPFSMPAEHRWRPTVLPEVDAEDRQRTGWYPGTIEAVTDTTVVLVLGVPDEDPARRRTVRKTLSHEEWRRVSRSSPRGLEGRFVEVGEYGDQHVEVMLLPAAVELHPASRDATDPWLRGWTTAE